MQQRRWCWLNHDRLKSTKRLHWIFIQWSLLVLFNLSKLDGQIYDIHHKDIPDDEKAKLYSASLNSYLDINKPTFLTKFESTAKESKDSEPANGGDDGESTVFKMVPKTLRSRTLQLLKHIKNNPDISWSGKGELILKNTVVPKSHAIDLLNDLMRKRVSTPAPTGWKQLADVSKKNKMFPENLSATMTGGNILTALNKKDVQSLQREEHT